MSSQAVVRLPGLSASVQSDSVEFIPALSALIPTEPDAPSDIGCEVTKRGATWHVTFHGRSHPPASDLDEALVAVYGGLYEYYVRQTEYLLIHTGAVSIDESAVLLPGGERSGKSTITAVIGGRTGTILSDDVGVIDHEAAAVFPYPRRVLIRPEALRRCSDLTRGVEVVRELYAHGERVYIARPRREAVQRPHPISFFVFPSWCPTRTALRRLSAGEAAVRLMDTSLNLRHLGSRGVRMVADLVRRVPAYEMEVRDAVEAARLIEDLNAT